MWRKHQHSDCSMKFLLKRQHFKNFILVVWSSQCDTAFVWLFFWCICIRIFAFLSLNVHRLIQTPHRLMCRRSMSSQHHHRWIFVLGERYQHSCETVSSHVCKHTPTHTSGLMFWFPGQPYCAMAAFNKWPSVYLCLPLRVYVLVCVCVHVYGCNWLICQPCWPHVMSSVSFSPLTLLSTTDHPPSPSPLQGTVAWKSTHASSIFIHSNLHQGMCECLLVSLASLLCGHDGGFFLQASQCCSAPEGSLRGRQRAPWAPHPPSRQQLTALKALSIRPLFTDLNGLALFIFTLCHKEGTPISQCHSGFVR